jgi:hypothetical protein
MDEDSEERRGFRVTDRRRFSDSGEAKPEATDVPREPAGSQATRDDAGRAADRTAEEHVEEPVTFSTFVFGLSTQALLHLGDIPNPLTNAIERDLEAAKHVIDILGILREKTRNNLEQSEDVLIESVLYDLRMRYVELVRRGTKEAT